MWSGVCDLMRAAGKTSCLAYGQKSHTRAAISFHLVLHTSEHVAGDDQVRTRLETN